MFDPEVSRQLRRLGHDVVGASEDSDLREMKDPALFRVAQEQGRVFVTENVGDFLEQDEIWRLQGEAHLGLILTSDHRFRRGTEGYIGRMVRALDRLLRTREDWPGRESAVHWLR